MALTKTQKEQRLAELADIISTSGSVAFVHFEGLSVGEADTLRAQLHEAGVRYRVVKKTLFERALQESDCQGEVPPLDGELAVAYSDDTTAAAREVYTFHENHKEQLWIMGGIFNGRLQSQEEMNEIATIPDMQTLRGMFVNVINAPIQGFASVLHQVAEQRGS